jgi:protein-tyrosine phosphatase
MAECLFNELCRRNGETELRALSAGLCTFDGMSASGGAIRAMASRGLSLNGHHSRRISSSVLNEADVIMGVSRRHIESIRTIFPDIQAEMYWFDPEISDPYQGSDALYENTAAEMEPQVAALFHLLATKAKKEDNK